MTRRSTSTRPAPSGPIGWQVVPKASGGTRRLIVLDPADELAFARSVVRVTPSIRRALGTESHANRLVGWDPRSGPVLEPWRHARRRWHGEVRRSAGQGPSIAVTDVRACYGSIAPSAIVHRLRILDAPPDGIEEVGSWLHVFREAGVEGLPTGPAASAVLAEAVLAAGDDAIRSTGATFVRWVDDVVIFAPDPRARASALRALSASWAGLGLELHEGKTMLIDEPGGVTASLDAASNLPAPPSTLR